MNENNNIGLLEAEFKQVATTFGMQIEAKIALSAQILKEAMELADAHGIPFYSEISLIPQSYVPTTFNKKFKDINPDVVEELTGVSEYDQNDAYGWHVSQVCY